ncbi:RNA-binding protein 34 [Heracleum sosnowskyi]|uniref:RNA-binding protein 34 n=1 Tax=Heracleum sosnowskyi TaxID=360622 RepID=A0AAD8HWX2_9APIA|nr:RNA-binding protein 34 [Heracleum sosnowskyi]
MGKKHSSTNKNGGLKPPSSSSGDDIFKSIFGFVSQEQESAQSASIFSDNNPFRRKPTDPSQQSLKIQQQNQESGVFETPDGGDGKKRKRSKDKVVVVGEGEGFSKKVKGKIGFLGKDEEGNVGVAVKDKKRKRGDIEAEYEAKRYGEVAVKDDKELGVGVGEKRKAMDSGVEMVDTEEGFDDEDKLLRTVFVGNLPLKVKKKALLKEFSQFGEIDSLRIRSVPIMDSKTPRKGAVIKKEFNAAVDNVHAYIVFKSDESAKASLSHNMAVVGGNHIRVDRACPPRKKLKGDDVPLYDCKRTVFIGNLPFDVKDEEIYQLFSGLANMNSSIEAIRVVRDPGTSLGKGIAFVLFKTKEAANLVVRKRNLKIRGRDLRLSHSKPNATPSKRTNLSPPGRSNSSATKSVANSRTPDSNAKTMSYQGMRASKSGVQKKIHTKKFEPLKFNSRSVKVQKPKERTEKRPSVAARKAKALKSASNGSKEAGGKKRKAENRTPSSSQKSKKARRS